MRPRTWMLRTLLLLALAPIAGRAADPVQTQWKLANFTWLKRVPAEGGAPANAHPAALAADTLHAMLEPVQAMVEGQAIPLFAKDELKALVKPLAEAFALAQPGEDLILLSTHKRGGSFMEMAVGLTARLFVRDGALNLIVQDTRLGFMDRYAADRTLPTFVYGSRTAASGASLQARGAAQPRADWLALPLLAAPARPAAPAPVAAPPAAAVTALATTPASPASAPAPEPPAAPRDAAFYEAQTQRLKALKKMRDEGVLTEAEYQAKREAILRTL